MGSTLILGASGGAGATTTTAGLANAAGLLGRSAVAVDATVGGGDLVDRAADRVVAPTTIESGYIDADMSVTSTGAQVLGRAWLQTSEPDYDRLDWYLRSRTDFSFYDFGHRAFGRDSARPLRNQPSAAVVLVALARADVIDRVRTALQTIALAAGRKMLDRTTVVLTHHVHGPMPGSVDISHLRRCLDGVVFAVDEVPFDPHLAAGTVVTTSALAQSTVDAYERIRATSARSAYGTLSA